MLSGGIPSSGGGERRNPLLYFLYSYRVTFLLIFALGALGVFTLLTLPRESTPEIDVPVAAVVAVWPGASARDVEELVTKPLEDELLSLEGLDTLTSSSRVGVSSLTVEFSANEDLDDAFRRLREAVDNVSDLPTDVEDPQVIEINFSDEPIISVSLGGVVDERLLAVYADDVADRLEDIPGVLQVDVVGSRTEEVHIRVDPQRLSDLGLSLGQLLGSLRAANLNAPFGTFETDRFNYDLRLVGAFDTVADVATTPVRLGDGSVVPLDAIASVSLGLSDVASQSRVSIDGDSSQPALTLSVRKKTGANIINVVGDVQDVLDETRLRGDIVVTTFADRAQEIRDSLSNVTQSGAQTLLIVFGLLWLFLGWRPALITAVAIPLTFSMAFLVFDATDTTLNSISLFSLILSLGLLVDNAIVVVEGIYTFSQHQNSVPLRQRAGEVVVQFTKPLIGGTLTTVAAFFPMLLVSGIIGQFLAVIPIVVTATLLSSLFVALAFIPPVAVALLGRHHGRPPRDRFFDRTFARFQERYDRFLVWALASRRFQRGFITVLTVLLMVGLSLPFTGLLRTGLFPSVDVDFMIINAELPPGSRLEETAQVAARIEEELRQIPEIESFVLNIGSGVSLDIGGGGTSSEARASAFVNLREDRKRSSLVITDELRQRFALITAAKVVVEEISAGPPTSAPVELRVVGEDLQELDRVSQNIADELASLPGAIDVDRNLRTSAGEFNFVFNRDALASYGLSAADVAQTLRASVFGVEATTFLDAAGDEVSVQVQGIEPSIDSVDDVLALPLLLPSGQQITVGQVAQVNLSSSLDAIRRRDGERSVTVTASTDDSITPNELSEQLQQRLAARTLPNGVRVVFGGEQQETVETFQELYRSMFISVILILLILVVEFHSYRQPLIIFLSIPLGLIGVLFGLLLFNSQLNFAAFIGLVSLTGIVVNNAIILVDRMNTNLAGGASLAEAVRSAAVSRLRPIILTTLTTAAGVAPLIWVDEFFRDMSITLITGLLFSTLLTLVLIPVLYLRQQQKELRRQGSVHQAVA